MRKVLWLPCLGLIALALLSGCGKTKNKVVPAEGTITFEDGSKLPVGTRVLLEPTEGTVGTASGKTDAEGKFKLTHVNGSSGAEVGKYTVKLLGPEGDKGEFWKLVGKDAADGNVLSVEITDSGMKPSELKIPKPKVKQ